MLDVSYDHNETVTIYIVAIYFERRFLSESIGCEAVCGKK